MDKLVTTSKVPRQHTPPPPKIRLPTVDDDDSPSKPNKPGKKGKKWLPLSLGGPAGSSTGAGEDGEKLALVPLSTKAVADEPAKLVFKRAGNAPVKPWAHVVRTLSLDARLLPKHGLSSTTAPAQGLRPTVPVNEVTPAVAANEVPFIDVAAAHFPAIGASKDVVTKRRIRVCLPAPADIDQDKDSINSPVKSEADEDDEQLRWSDEKSRLQQMITEREKALARKRARARARWVRKRLEKLGKRQLRLPNELWMPILLELTSRDRSNFGLTCREANAVLSIVTTVWNDTAGEFEGHDVGEKQVLRAGSAPPTTRHAITVIRPDPEHACFRYRDHEINMLQRMALAVYNMADHIRHLEFRATPVMPARLLQLLVPALPNLEYLGIFRCPRIHLAHTEMLLFAIRAGVRQSPVRLDFYPSTNWLTYCEDHVDVPIAISAYLYRILPQARRQSARLIGPGTAFPRFLNDTACGLTPEMLWAIEHGRVTDAILRQMTGSKTALDPKCPEARLRECHATKMAGCFFVEQPTQRKGGGGGGGGGYPFAGHCCGCRLESLLLMLDSQPFGGMFVHKALTKWLNMSEGWDLDSVLDKARRAMAAPLPPRRKDKTWCHIREIFEYRRVLRLLVAAGKVPPGTTVIPEKYDPADRFRRPKKR